MRPLATLALAGLFLIGAPAQSAPPSTSDLQRGADQLVATTEIPAVITLVEHDGERTVVAAGEADIHSHTRALPAHRFWVGSVTKSFIATVVMQLVAERRLRLDDTVARLLPGRLREGRRIRLRQLLNHTSGIHEYMRLEPWRSAVARNPRVVIPARTLVSSAARLPLDFPPGSRAAYSNTNYLVLGEILERVTGRRLATLLRDRIFAPLDLDATAFESGRAHRGDQMHGYDITGARPRDVSLHRLGGPWADGAIVSNARDLAVFFGALLRGRLVPPALVAEMTRVVPGSHGLGLGIFKLGSPCGRGFYGNTGGTPGYLTFAAGSRDGRRLYVLAVNGVDPRAMEAIVGRYLDDLLCGHSPAALLATDVTVTATSRLGLFTGVITHPRPIPIERLHTWKLQLFDRRHRPVTGAQITVTGDMPAHGHGLPTTPIAVSRGDGRYELQGMMFQMPGRWYVQLRIRSAGRVDLIRIRFTIAP
jgi:D-alanyl-D-alanine carboxypeptidase